MKQKIEDSKIEFLLPREKYDEAMSLILRLGMSKAEFARRGFLIYFEMCKDSRVFNSLEEYIKFLKIK